MTPSHHWSPRVALASCLTLPEPDLDFEPLARALRGQGCDVAAFPWDGPGDIAQYDVCVLRSTWNYYRHAAKFLEWIDRTAQVCTLLNPATIVRWNADKRYLFELREAGVPVVETVWFEPGSRPESLGEIARERHWSRFVVKPIVSAASYQTKLFETHQLPAAIDFLASHLTTRGMMAQPFVESVNVVGEKSIAWIDGEITHAWIKRPRFADEHERVEPHAEITAQDHAVVDQAVRDVRKQILYARIDLMYGDHGQPLLSELELIEPSLYFDFSRAALDRFANGLLRRVGQGGRETG